MKAELAIKWSVSRAQDTYGYNVCTMVGVGPDGETVKARCLGGGYDMLGTCLAQVTMTLFPEWFDGTMSLPDPKDYYGLSVRPDWTAYLNGACGVECIEKFLKEVIGAKVEWEYSRDRKGRIKDKSGVVITRD